ncbi:MAG: D-glycero-beta-D-manno-heptose 1-phosphate adenylyltransferase, partial [Candidatus Competibacterales bacterium]
ILAPPTAGTQLVPGVGGDAPGGRCRGLVAELPKCEAGLADDPERPTTVKTRCIGGHQQMLRIDREDTQPIGAPLQSQLLAAALAALPQRGEGIPTVVLSDYGKGVLPLDFTRGLLGALEGRARVIVDPKGDDYRRYGGAYVVTPNLAELHVATGCGVEGYEAIVAAAKGLMDRCGIANVLVTRGERGMTLVPGTGEVVHIPARAQDVFDVSGAGDTVVAVLAAALGSGAPLVAAAHLANVAAGIVVGKLGTAEVRLEELLQALSSQDRDFQGGEVAPSLAAAEEMVDIWRAQGLKVGFTNGCFDLLHPGHVALLHQARRACDRLVVGLNTDASVKGLKGPTRAVQHQGARAAVLAALASVDLVVLFDEPTPLVLIQHLRPDVLVKGADYTIDQVVGADVVQRHGGRVILAELIPDQSTSRLVAKMAQGPASGVVS